MNKILFDSKKTMMYIVVIFILSLFLAQLLLLINLLVFQLDRFWVKIK